MINSIDFGLRLRRARRRRAARALVVGASIFGATPLLAQTKNWIGTNGGPSGSWDNPAGWAPAGQPQGGDDVLIAVSGATVTYANTAFPTAVLSGLQVGAAGGLATLSQNQHTLNTSALRVGGAGLGAVALSGGTLNVLTADGLVIGDNPGSLGTLAVSGAGQLNVAGQLLVGDVGPGTLTQSAGAIQVTTVGGLPGTLAVGAGVASVGTYNMTGGTLDTALLQIAPFGGIATFNQTAGQINVSQELSLGDTLGFGSFGSANFNHAGGTLTTPLTTISQSATLEHSGGIYRTAALVIDTDALPDQGGKLDVTDKNFVIDYTGPSPLADVSDYVQSGYNDGDWDGAGIVSKAAQSTAGTAVGYAEAADVLGLSGNATALWNGHVVDATTLLVDHTRAGDASMNGSVGFEDLVRLAQNYGDASGDAIWSKGDFNYDGGVSFEDLVILAQNYGQSLPAAAIAGAPAGFDEDLARAMAQVPEPGGVGLIALASCGVLTHRRRFTRKV